MGLEMTVSRIVGLKLAFLLKTISLHRKMGNQSMAQTEKYIS